MILLLNMFSLGSIPARRCAKIFKIPPTPTFKKRISQNLLFQYCQKTANKNAKKYNFCTPYKNDDGLGELANSRISAIVTKNGWQIGENKVKNHISHKTGGQMGTFGIILLSRYLSRLQICPRKHLNFGR